MNILRVPHRFAHLLGFGSKSRAPSKPGPRRAGLQSKRPTPAKRIEPTVSKPKPAASHSPAYTASSFAHLGSMPREQWSAMWRDKTAMGGDASGSKERARMLSILGSPEAAKHPPLAAHLAFATELSAANAISLLSTAAPLAISQPRISLSDRMAGIAQPRVGTEAPQPAADTPEAQAASVLNAMNRARPPARN
ncbi:MAG: hypothetical protein JWR10_2451 [Rubritepida sp.]|nr:hypothetical protein [Rubritepida sp.]